LTEAVVIILKLALLDDEDILSMACFNVHSKDRPRLERRA